MTTSWQNLSRSHYYAALFLGLLITGMTARLMTGPSPDGRNDYLQFYAGARLVGTPYLLDSLHIRHEQVRAAGYSRSALEHFVRPPFYAVLLWPLGKLPFEASYLVWQSISLAALVGFLLLWHVPNRRLAILACSWSFPLMAVFVRGQDVVLLLGLLALVFQFHDKRPMITGLMMSLFAIKFNLFLLLPLLLVGQRRWKMASGFLLGSVVLIAASFAAAGSIWPAQMYATLSSKAIAPREDILPNFRGLLQPFTDQLVPELLLDSIAGGMVWIIVRLAAFECGMAAVILGSLLVSHHAGPPDAALMIPALLIVASRTTVPWINRLCFILLTPLPYLLLTYGDGFGSVTVLLLSALLLTMSVEHLRASALPCPIRVSEHAQDQQEVT
ncbi:MAG TPA: glycosyltransferase family 87 protein [Terriglobales bacterium]|nr:glycosyltransferase family 87 protein [Terriglobales bacterium]